MQASKATDYPLSSHAPGWAASLELGFRRGAARTDLHHRRRNGPLAVQRAFYPEGEVCHVYLLHPPGGIVGGDQLTIDVAVDGEALVTTPGAGKFYRSAGDTAEFCQNLQVGEGSRLEWLPQETILFPGAEVDLRTEIELASSARLAWWEVICLGRPVIDESFAAGRLSSRLLVKRDGRPLLLEHTRIDAQSRHFRSRLAGQPVFGTMLLDGTDDADLAQARALAPELAATRLDDLLVLRYLGADAAEARHAFARIWLALRPKLFGPAAAEPRIWST